MKINTDLIISMTEANQNFSKVARNTDNFGKTIIFKNNKPKYVVVNADTWSLFSLYEDEIFELVALKILRKYQRAFEVLAK